jgi:hypothetical protein
MLRRSLLAVAAFTLLASPALAQTDLSWKLKEGERFFVEEKVVTKQSVHMTGNDVKQETTARTVIEFTVKGRTPEAVVMQAKVLYWRATVTENGSAKPENKVFEDMAKDVVLTFKLTPDNQVKELSGFETILKKVEQSNPQDAKALKAVNMKGLLESSLRAVFAVAPNKSVKSGESWKVENTIPAGGIGTIVLTTTYTSKGKDKDKEAEKITSEATFTYQPPKTGDEAALGFKVVKADLKAKVPGKGTAYFNAVTGRLVSAETSLETKGTVTYEAQGTQIEVSLDSLETRQVRCLANSPLK